MQKLSRLFCVLLVAISITSDLQIHAQTVVNNGGFIVVEPGAFVVISDNFINKNDSIDGGKVDLDGTIILGRNWVNTADNEVITDIGTSPMGDVIMNGSINQYIEGTHPTHFENLVLRNSEKILNVSDCEVNGRLTVDAVLNLNSAKIIIDNPSQDAITYVSKYILSETSPDDGYGEVQWNIADHTLSYEIPFGSGTTPTRDLNLVLTTRTPGDANGAISFATYNSGCHNTPYPTTVSFLEWDKEYIADRYWSIKPLFPSSKPMIDITFKYTDADIDPNCNESIMESELKAARYSTLVNQWQDMTPDGIDDPASNTLTIKDVSAANFFAPWALVQEQVPWELFLPNAFTPNNDGLNDGFGPQGLNLETFKAYSFYIYDRWGEQIFHSGNPAVLWNGSVNNDHKICQEGIYVWMLHFKDHTGVEHVHHGTVTLVGKVK